MTHLELVAQIGAESVEIARMYFEGQLSSRELLSVLGEHRAEKIRLYQSQETARERR